MSDRSNDAPLFQNMDEQEKIYAPQQVPGTVRDDVDDGSTGRDADGEAVVGDTGAYATPIIPANTTQTSGNAPVPVAPVPDLITERDQERRDRDE